MLSLILNLNLSLACLNLHHFTLSNVDNMFQPQNWPTLLLGHQQHPANQWVVKI
jgi:hypothetical protein